jgi:O-antigen chain-terminating methyltransferase
MADTEPPSTPQQQRLQRLNELWRIAGPEPAAGSLAQRLLHEMRLIAARLLRPQETFNAALVEYIDHQATVIEELTRHGEQLETRARRVEAGFGTLQATHEELRTSLGVLQQAARTLKHEVARLAEAGAPAAPTATSGAAASASSDGLDSYTYVGFENEFRGDPEVIRARQADYVPVFSGASDVLDVGCGRGEFLSLLAAAGIPARGIDLNPSMVQVCRERGLRADTADALAFLRAQPDSSLGGLFAAQVVEHLEPMYLTALLSTAFDKLRPGAPLVLETINPACWFAFFESYLRDITHVRALHPETLKFLVVASGFQRVEVSYRAPYPDQDKLQPVPQTPALAASINTLNANVEKLNRLLFTWLDYAVIGHRP